MAERTLKSIRPRVSELLQRPGIPRAVIAVARDGRPVEHLAVGSNARGRPLAPDSLFPVASITKLATALSVLRLADRGALHCQDRLDAYLPESAAAHAGVTLRVLFTHTGGLQGMEEELAPWTPDYSWTVESEAALRVAPEISPGARLSYSDVDYVLLAMVVERLTDQPFTAACRELVIDPLGMEGYFAEEPPRPPAWIGDDDQSRRRRLPRLGPQ
jgi:CubicO group peptidase (beta-lactamase class C family)